MPALLLAPVAIAFSQNGSGDLAQRVAALTQTAPAVERGRFGYKVVDLETGEVLAAQDAEKFFTPASNTKLYTTALALVRLGPNYKFHTELRTADTYKPGQTNLDDLQLIGGGDPNLSGRMLPYTVDSTNGDPFSALEELAGKLVESGVREIDGDVTGVATRYPGELYPDGWTVADSIYGYGAPVSSLTLNDNTISLVLHPAAAGELAQVELRPAVSHLVILNEVITDASKATRIEVSRAPGSNEVVVWGTLGSATPEWRQDLAIDDPALFAAEALMAVLRDRGVTVRGVARSEYRAASDVPNPIEELPALSPRGTLLAVHESPPLWEAIQVTNKVSQNLHAEMLLREVAQVTHGVGTLEAGRIERRAFLEEIGITHDATGFALADGSGLARQDLTTPDSTVALLDYMWQRPERDLWMQSLPTGGVDGTLQHRFADVAGAQRIHAKTGSLSHVNALSGYIEMQQHRWLAFSIMVNATEDHDSEVRAFIDHLCALFLDR